jgi:hypothetical protein
MQPDSEGRYLHYEGSSYDRQGRRDQVVGCKITNDEAIRKLNAHRISDGEKLAAIRELFG